MSTSAGPRIERSSFRTNLALFTATLASVFFTGAVGAVDLPAMKDAGLLRGIWLGITHQTPATLLEGAKFAASVLTILTAHELGHYVAARIHKVDATLPFFIPMPILSPFGTMGAVIRMRGAIPTRRALLDIGASGPLAGLVFAIPLYAWGVAHSKVIPLETEGMAELGESLLVRGLDRLFAPGVPDGMTIAYSPIAFGAWGGLFVTMINLLPVGQLDGGHVAYSLFGPNQDRYAKLAHRAMLAFFFVAIAGHAMRDLSAGRALTAAVLGRHVANSVFWLVWFELLAVLGSLASRANDGDTDPPKGSLGIRTRVIATIGLVAIASIGREHASWLLIASFFVGLGMLIAMEIKGGTLRPHSLLDHPPTGKDELDGLRKAVAIVTLVLFALLFMPAPFSL